MNDVHNLRDEEPDEDGWMGWPTIARTKYELTSDGRQFRVHCETLETEVDTEVRVEVKELVDHNKPSRETRTEDHLEVRIPLDTASDVVDNLLNHIEEHGELGRPTFLEQYPEAIA